MDILLVIDMQVDFISGALGSPQAKAIVDPVIAKVRSFNGLVLATRDSHDECYLDTQEGRYLPVPHCLIGSHGWQLDERLRGLIDGDHILDKRQFGAYDLPDFINRFTDQVNSITLVGVCTGICVISNALILKARFPEVRIVVDSSCCACVSANSHQVALEAMKLCQVEVV